jgi:hypothetical protein
MKLMGPYRHPVMMKKTGRLKDIAIVVYGRAVAALSAKAKGIPEPVRNAIRDAPAAIWSPARRTHRALTGTFCFGDSSAPGLLPGGCQGFPYGAPVPRPIASAGAQ